MAALKVALEQREELMVAVGTVAFEAEELERAARAELEKQIQALHAAIHDLRPASGGGQR